MCERTGVLRFRGEKGPAFWPTKPPLAHTLIMRERTASFLDRIVVSHDRRFSKASGLVFAGSAPPTTTLTPTQTLTLTLTIGGCLIPDAVQKARGPSTQQHTLWGSGMLEISRESCGEIGRDETVHESQLSGLEVMESSASELDLQFCSTLLFETSPGGR